MNRSRAEWDHLTPTERAQKLGRAGVPAFGMRMATSPDGEVLAPGQPRARGLLATARGDRRGRSTTDGSTRATVGPSTTRATSSISDRKKDIIITGGENVSSIEIEDVLFSHPAVAEVAVIGVPAREVGRDRQGARRAGARAPPIEEAELIEHCRARIAHFKCPTSIEFRSELARTATGKLQKFRLREPYWRDMDKQVN